MSRGRTVTVFAAVVGVLMCTAAPSTAGEGLSLGLNMLFNDIGGGYNSPKTAQSGNGLGLRGGYGFHRHVAVEAGLWMTKHNMQAGASDAYLKAGTLDLKLLYPMEEGHIEPYVLAGGGRYLMEQEHFSDRGKGGRIGMGVNIALVPHVSLNIGLTRNTVTFTHNAAGQDARITTMDLGCTYHFR